jgi:Gas vesicle synthesis protein GvpL/GvpF
MAMTAARSRARRVSDKACTYVYGVTWAETAKKRRGAGVGGADLDVVVHRDLAAVVSDVPPGPVRAKRRDLMRHMDVLQHVFDDGAVLPLQFGSVFPARDAVADGLLAERRDELVRLLKQFDGLAELRLRATYREDAILAEIVEHDRNVARLRELTRQSGAADPRRLQLGEAVAHALAARRDHDAHAFTKGLQPIARDIVVEEPRTEYEVLRASFLVDRRKISTFDARLDELAGPERERMRFTYTGPLPPHSFVGLANGRSR